VADKKRRIFKITGFALVGIALVTGVFVAGWAVGQGKVSITGSFAKEYSSQNTALPDSLDYRSVDQAYRALKDNYDGKLTQAQLLDGVKEGLAKATGDPYTQYFTKDQAKDFDQELNGSFTGIGAELGKEKDNIVVISPISGFPAEKAGLQSRDIIVQIDGKDATGMSVEEAVGKVRGPAGTTVKLKVIRGNSQEVDLAITRQVITIPSVKSNTDNGICTITIARFAEDTAQLTTDAANKCKTAGTKAAVLDVRSDPGGLLDAAVSVASLWLPQGKTVLQEKRGSVVVKTYPSDGSATLAGMPTVVLMNEGSASASEIVAGALHDNKAATLIGTKSYGKGSVQELHRFEDGSLLKVTIARWYTPGGRNIDKQGLEPDQKASRTAEDYTNGRDPQMDAALKALNK